MTPLRFSVVLGLIGGSIAAIIAFSPGPRRLSGTYGEVGGPGRLEFNRDRVYITSLLGMTFAAEYEVDGEHVIIRDGGGSRVYTLHGDTLEAGVGMTFVKEDSGER